MLRLYSFVCFIVAIATAHALPTRVELLSRTENHDRKKADATIGIPEFSRDGNFVLYLSAANNLTTNSPVTKPALNLYMFDRQTSQTTLVSQGPNGAPANADVVNFEISADNRRVLFETSASNIIGNDTNNATDIFVRDLEQKTNILVSANTNGTVSRLGARDATMSSDGNLVLFLSEDTSLSAQKSSAFVGAFVRNIAAGTTESLNAPPGNDLLWASDPVISDDGRFAAFTADTKSTGSSGYVSMNVLCDLQSGASVQMAGDIPGSYEGPPIITPDGKFVVFEINNFGSAGTTNVVVRYASETGAADIVASNNVVAIRPVAISTDGGTILGAAQMGYRIYRDGAEMRAFPKQADGSLISLPAPFGRAALSADGKFVTFSTDVPLLASDGDISQFRTYVYDVEHDSLSEIPLTSIGASPSDPVLNVDGSSVVFTGPAAGIHDQDEAAQDNIYIWDRATGQIQLVSKLDTRNFENTDAGDSKIPEAAAFSDDGQKMVFASRAPASGVTDGNGSWDIFVLDLATGRKQLVSVAEDGQSIGSGASLQPIISWQRTIRCVC
jgi:hypothetical protein